MTKQRILVCGATGFVGRNMAEAFAGDSSCELHAVFNKRLPFEDERIVWHKCDLTNPHQVSSLLKKVKPAKIIQAAATTSGAKDIVSTPQIHVTDNAVMNSYLFRDAVDNEVQHLVFFSCTVMYQSSDRPIAENAYDANGSVHPRYFGVANTKLYIEKICKFYSDISKTKFSIIRHSNLYGPHDKFDLNKGHFIGSSILKVHLSKNEIDIFGKGNERRDYLFINDFIDFVKKIIKKQKNNYEIYNCSYGKSYPIKEILKKIINLSGMKKKINHLSGKNLNINIAVSNKKAKKEIQWRPTTKLDKGLKKTINWFKKNEKFLQK